MQVRKAIIPAAGLGTRFLPATKAQPKEMLPIVDKPTIQYIIEEAVSSGIEDILIITGRGKRAIEDHFDKSYELEEELLKHAKHDLLEIVQGVANLADIHYVRQKEALGLGHAIHCARKFIGNEPFAVLLGDDIVSSDKPCLMQMIEIYERVGTSVIGIQVVPDEDLNKYGIIKAKGIEDRLYKIEDLVEKPNKENAPSNLAIMGRYIIDPEIFDILDHTTPGAGGEIQLTDALKVLNTRQQIYGYIFKGKRYDVGDKLGYLQATVEFALQREDLREDFKKYLLNLVGQSTSNKAMKIG
ncbi:MAG: UTP--glucose-1-phosphate uridylyltransferase GalU [Clostridia bacterium]|nr:UTP--glucose-1-phosphate uridylyltransferase GalU [Clostridia bacterium]